MSLSIAKKTFLVGLIFAPFLGSIDGLARLQPVAHVAVAVLAPGEAPEATVVELGTSEVEPDAVVAIPAPRDAEAGDEGRMRLASSTLPDAV